MRILIHPRPTNRVSGGIFLGRFARELRARGYESTSLLYHFTGLPFCHWDYGFVMGTPRFGWRVLHSGKPVCLTMGKPESRDWCQAAGVTYTDEHEAQRHAMFAALRLSPRIVFMSRFVRDIWRDIFRSEGVSFPEESTRVILHGLDVDQFVPATAVPPFPFVIGCAGAMRNRFRLSTLFVTSRKLHFDHRILLVGSLDPECRRELALAMSDSALSARITHVPWRPAGNLVPYYQRMHCLFHPVDYEACGIVVTEALSCGVPVVVPDHGAPREYLGGGGILVNGRQYCYDDAFCSRMAQAVTEVYKGHARFARAARSQAVQHFSIKSVVSEYLSFMGVPLCQGRIREPRCH